MNEISLEKFKRVIDVFAIKYWLIPQIKLPEEIKKYDALLYEVLSKIDELNKLSNKDGIHFDLDIGLYINVSK